MNFSINTVSCGEVDLQALKPFPSELDLVDNFERLFDCFLNNGVLLEREFNCGFGIADAVIFDYKKETSLLDLAKISPEWAYTLKVLPYRKNFCIDLVLELSGASLSSSRKAIKDFIQAGFCQDKGNGIYIKNRQPRALCTSVVAIEAKLKDWKKALWQATRYKTFANESWVVLDRRYSRPAISNLTEFKKFNIGLATFSTDGCYNVHFLPKKETHKSDIAYWKANTLLAKRLAS